jgi:hypothetical protein
MAGKIVWQTEDYTIQNFPLPPQANRLPRREVGHVKPIVYRPGEDMSHFLDQDAYRMRFAPSFESLSVIEPFPGNKCGTGYRRIDNSAKSRRSHGEHDDSGMFEI